ncbi:hypothetical protein [Bacillus sp. AFS041924]|uniref:hypothetical protein n=1 Tax=Bacillus sp. AFS041924 TaxID=2033503 RepID=UPI000BFCD8B3|nr:hypothetical protein [Bacillus sp. AFS041924]PGS51289.1 hypothetical protein COC46_11645 [Bacillus sp. AFS041924]
MSTNSPEIFEPLYLPFTIAILVGTRGKEEKISLDALTMNPKEAYLFAYEIQELKRFLFQVDGDFDGKITFIWNNLYHFQQENLDDQQFIFTQENRRILIYEHGKTENAYPWRCGYYEFCIIYQEQHFYGMIKIVPKNLEYDQLEWMHATLNQQINGIMNDSQFFKKSSASFTQNGTMYFWPIIRFIESSEERLLVAIQQFISKLKRKQKKEYELKRQVKKLDFNTIRWNLIHPAISNATNLTMQPVLQEENYLDEIKYAKNKVRKFLLTIETLLTFVKYELVKDKNKMDQINFQVKDIEKMMQNVVGNGSITDREKAKYRQSKLLKEIELEKLTKSVSEKVRITNSLEKLYEVYFREYTIGIFRIATDTDTSNYPSSPSKVFLNFIHSLSLFDKKVKEYGKKQMLLPVYKPTFLLYEYFVFFSLCDIFLKLKFKNDSEPLAEQILMHIKDDELMDGAFVTLENKDWTINLVYNEIIEGSPQVSLLKGTNFFSGEESKKPDIRLDFYRKKNKEYVASIIFEIKYSPMFNIYQPVGNTKAMEQMYKYWGLKYVERINGKMSYVRKPINEVICLYPGSNVHRKVLEAGCGTYIQFYPRKKGEDFYELIGERELIEIINRTIDEIK